MATRMISGKKTIRLTGKTADLCIAAGAEVTILFEPPSTGSVRATVECGARSRVTWITLASTAKELVITLEGAVGAKASLTWRMVTGGKGNLQCNLTSRVTGDDGTSAIQWVAGAKGTAKQQLSASNIFTKKRGGGEINLRAVAAEKAHVSCKGSILIGEKGTGTQTHLTQETLMLDATAKVDAVPALEIKTNDVKASHSATVARVTPETLFYFQSRGIDEATARTMFIDGFVGELLMKLPGEAQKTAESLLR